MKGRDIMTACIFNIQRFCVNDGPGIRTTVFIKGCPLKCLWCHNPESQNKNRELMYYEHRCVNCLRCIKSCPENCHVDMDGKHIFDRTRCALCFACTENLCPALDIAGKEYTPKDLLKEILKDAPFFKQSGGGVTLSGGEPLFQPEFTLELLKLCRQNGIHTAMETCGFASEKTIRDIAPYTDLFLFDWKETNPEKHKEFTGADNSVILRNLEILQSLNAHIILRCPIIPGCNDTDEHFRGIAEIADRFSMIEHVEIEPCHAIGEGKYLSLGKQTPSLSPPDDETVKGWIETIQSHTTKNVIKA